MRIIKSSISKLKSADNHSQKKYYIQTFGCQANIKDSQNMAGSLEALGFLRTSDYKIADVLIINTCSVRQKSEDKVYGWGIKLGTNNQLPRGKPAGYAVLNFGNHKSPQAAGYFNPKIQNKSGKEEFYKKKGNQIVFVTGCMIGSAKGDRTRIDLKNLKEKLNWADYMLAPDEEYLIPSILVKEKLVDSWAISALDHAIEIDPSLQNDTEWAYVNVSTGCDNFCTFCVVPYARGKEISRTMEDIIHEVKHLVDRGYKNIMLVGQNVNSWGLDRETKFKLRAGSEHKIPFADLLRNIHAIDNVEKINFISSNPFDFTQDLIDTLALPKITRFLHFAVQSGNNEILQKMNRRHTIEEFKDLVNRIRDKVPEMEFGTDIIVGFPGETEEQFMDTYHLFEWMPFKSAYISMYSVREGTAAAKFMKDDVKLNEKKRRHKILLDLWQERNPIKF